MRTFWFLPLSLLATPPKEMPPDLYREFTLGGTVPVGEWYIDNSYPPEKPIVFEVNEINRLILKAMRREQSYYGATDTYLYEVLDKYVSCIQGRKIGIIGSTTPWYECVILAYGGHPVTIDYNKIISTDSRIQTMTVEEYEQNPQKFDSILSVSSIEHDGLGRYGDPINPRGDFEAILRMKEMLNEGGLLFLSIPVGRDAIIWNAHRIYGEKRLPLLLQDWELVDSAGFSGSDLSVDSSGGHQPVFVLSPIQKM